MVIVYADDELAARRAVSRALQSRGHTVYTLNTGHFHQLQADALRLLKLVKAGLEINIFVLDGHNLLSDEGGQPMVDMTPLGVLGWLNQNGLAQNSQLILYSNDSQLVAQALNQNQPKFADALCKVGPGGGLQALLDSIERVRTAISLAQSEPA